MAYECYRCRNFNMRRTATGGLECPDCGHYWQPQGVIDPHPGANGKPVEAKGKPVITPLRAVIATIAVIGVIATIAVIVFIVVQGDDDPSFANCRAAEAHYGPGPFPTEHPVYSARLDGDGDGEACEPYIPN